MGSLYTERGTREKITGGASLERVTRRRLLAAGGGAVLASAVVGTANAQVGGADKPFQSPWALTFDVMLDPRSMDSLRQPGGAVIRHQSARRDRHRGVAR